MRDQTYKLIDTSGETSRVFQVATLPKSTVAILNNAYATNGSSLRYVRFTGKIAYKVVKAFDNKLQSTTHHGRVSYAIGKTTRPPSLHENQFLFVFSQLRYARRWADSMSCAKILKCEVENLTESRVGAGSNGRAFVQGAGWPIGTVWADTVTPFKIINHVTRGSR